jgi:hypothetical protein
MAPINVNQLRGTIYTDQASLERDAEPLRTSIRNEFTTLSAILSRHEDVIRKRWTKKTVEQRKKALRDAWPEINTTHRPDFRVWRLSPRRVNAEASQAYMFPHINLEDLSRGPTLLRFLSSRGRHHPSLFVGIDFDNFEMGRKTGIIQRWAADTIDKLDGLDH